jgi:hypothetical protein
LHLGAFARFVTSDNAAGRRSQNSMVSSKMACDATDGSAFKPIFPGHAAFFMYVGTG